MYHNFLVDDNIHIPLLFEFFSKNFLHLFFKINENPTITAQRIIAKSPYKNDSPANPNICVFSLSAMAGTSHCTVFTSASAGGFALFFVSYDI